MINFSCTKQTTVFVTNFVFLIQFDCLFVMMEICLFWAGIILPNCVFPPGFPPYFRCGLYLNACSTSPIHILTSSQPVVKLMENF